MPLNFVNEGGGAAYIRYSVEENEWIRSGEGGGLTPLEYPLNVIVDVENVQLGWLSLSGGREWLPWPNNDPTQIRKPSDNHKQGFSVKFYSSKSFGDEPVREFCANGTGTNMFIKKLYDECEATGNFKSGQVPAIKITKAPEKLKIGAGSTRVPAFEIVKWVDRPAELDGGGSVPPSTAAAASSAAPAPSSSGADDDEDFEI